MLRQNRTVNRRNSYELQHRMATGIIMAGVSKKRDVVAN